MNNNDKNQRNLSDILIEAMRYHDLNLEKLSQLTNISERFIKALIEGRYKELPAVPYVRGYIKKIAQTLNLNGEDLWLNFLKNSKELKKSGENDKLPANRFLINKQNIKFLFLIFFLILILLFYFVYVNFFSNSLKINFLEPISDEVLTDKNYFIFKGTVNKNNILMMNNQNIPVTDKNYFEYKVDLQPGFNNFEFKIKNNLGDNKVVYKQIFYQTTTKINEEKSE